jgi:phosphoesterase RecJ-like protein
VGPVGTTLERILEEVGRRNRFVLTSHARPDGDAIGSVLGCAEILRSMGKEADVVLPHGVPLIYRPLPFADRVLEASRVNGKYEAAILLECESVQRSALQGLEGRFLINIDHHKSGRAFANLNWIDPQACATAEMIYRLGRAAKVTITAEIATCLYTAVLTDTGSFCYGGTSERTFALAQELVHCGADPVQIAQSVYFSRPASKVRLMGVALSSLHIDGTLAWISVTREEMDRCNATDEDCEGLVNYALTVDGVEVALFFRETQDQRWRVSLRSKGAVDVAKVAEHFGGGGHVCASGCSLDGPLSVAVERVVAQLRMAGAIQSRA